MSPGAQSSPGRRASARSAAEDSAAARHDEDLLAPSEAAEIATRSVRTIRRAYSAGHLRAFRDRGGRGVRIRYADLRSWMLGEEISPPARGGELAPAPQRAAAPAERHLALLRAARRSAPRGAGPGLSQPPVGSGRDPRPRDQPVGAEVDRLGAVVAGDDV